MNPSLELSLRDRVRPSDAEAIEKLLAATGVFSPEEVAIAVALVRDTAERGPITNYHFLLACREEVVVGYACFGAIPATRGRFELYWIAVDPFWQRAGVGLRLLRETEARVGALGGSRLYVDTSGRADYAATRRFYTAAGYAVEATLRDFFAPGDDKVVFVREL